MAKMSPDADTQTQSLEDHLVDLTPNITVTTKPVVVCGVQRKANTGNYENIDIYCAIALPIDVADMTDTDALVAALNEAAKIGFHTASSEVLTRYQKVKNG